MRPRIAAPALVLTLLFAGSASANLIQNGSFEDGTDRWLVLNNSNCNIALVHSLCNYFIWAVLLSVILHIG